MLKKIIGINAILSTKRTPSLVVHTNSVRFQSTGYTSCDGLVIEPKNQVLWIKFDRPQKLNSITREMYENIADTLNSVNEDDTIKAVVLTGNGNYYSSGNDLKNLSLAMEDKDGPKAGLIKSTDILLRFVNSMINLQKFLIGAVNGPAVGIPVTTLPLFDLVIASDRASFQTPFTALGQCPEACSSYTFPRILGPSKANELLMLNMKWDAKKAKDSGLISEVVEHDKFQAYLDAILYGKVGIVNTCYPNSLKVCKSLARDPITKQRLIETNKRECEAILGCWLSEECREAIQNFFERSKKR